MNTRGAPGLDQIPYPASNLLPPSVHIYILKCGEQTVQAPVIPGSAIFSSF